MLVPHWPPTGAAPFHAGPMPGLHTSAEQWLKLPFVSYAQFTNSCTIGNVILEQIQTLQNIASVKAFGNEPYEEQRYRSGLDRFLAIVLRAARFEGGFISFIVFALFGSIVLVVWYGARL